MVGHLIRYSKKSKVGYRVLLGDSDTAVYVCAYVV